MQKDSTFAPRYPTHQEIRRGLARGRRARAQAFSAMAAGLVDLLIGRKVRSMGAGRKVAAQAG